MKEFSFLSELSFKKNIFRTNGNSKKFQTAHISRISDWFVSAQWPCSGKAHWF